MKINGIKITKVKKKWLCIDPNGVVLEEFEKKRDAKAWVYTIRDWITTSCGKTPDRYYDIPVKYFGTEDAAIDPLIFPFYRKPHEPVCLCDECPFSRRCRFHETSGDFRSLEGDLRYLKGRWRCSKVLKGDLDGN